MAPPSANAAGPASPAAGLIRSFMPELNTLRGIAVLGVLFRYSCTPFYWQYPGFSFGPFARTILAITQIGWLGVNLFFVLALFLITGILLDSKNRPNYYRPSTRAGLCASFPHTILSSFFSGCCAALGLGLWGRASSIWRM
jgi:hypothetical protein